MDGKELNGQLWLVIGGTGMLSKTCVWLAEEGVKAIVLGRNENKLKSLTNNYEQLVPVLADYSDRESFTEIINKCIAYYGRFDGVVAWIHNDATEILKLVDEINGGAAKFIFHVMGSSSDVAAIKERVEVNSAVNYYQIQLGFVLEGGYSRWLTNAEISDGVIESIKEERDVLVGQLEPWGLKP